jgi:hypothetical protein
MPAARIGGWSATPIWARLHASRKHCTGATPHGTPGDNSSGGVPNAILTGDSDLVPAMKLARREGLRVYVDTLGSVQVRPELRSMQS